MTVKHALLALLSRRPASTYQLRKDYDAAIGQSSPMNIGQVATTLQRLERDGLVQRPERGDDRSDAEAPSERALLWQLTPNGRAQLGGWWRTPVTRASRGRDELVIKLAMAAIAPDVDHTSLIQTQREATLRELHDVTRLRHGLNDDELLPRLLLDHHLFAAEAELRWLDDAEETLRAAAVAQRRAATRRSEADAAISAEAAASAEAPRRAGGRR